MRIAGVTIPDHKRVEIALLYLYGIGPGRARALVRRAGLEPHRRVKDLKTEEEQSLRQLIDEFKIEGALKREVAGNIKRLIDIKSYRGGRHHRKLPARGQRTKTNSRTRRGNVRKTMGSGRKKVEKK